MYSPHPPPCMGPGVKPYGRKWFWAFQRAKMSPQDTQLNTLLHLIFFKNQIKYCKTCLKLPLKKKTKNHFSRPIIPYINAGQKYCRMLPLLSTFIYLPFVIKIVFCLFCEWLLKTGFAVTENLILAGPSCTHMRICVHLCTPLGLCCSHVN